MRWTIEVLPEAGTNKNARGRKTARKPRRTQSSLKKGQTAPTAKPLVPVQRAPWLPAIITVAAVMLVVAAVAFPRRFPAPGAGAQPEQRDAAVDVAPTVQPIAPTPVPRAARAAASIVDTPRLVDEPPKKPALKPVTNRVRPGTSPASVATAAAAAEPPKHEEPATKAAAAETLTSAAATSTASTLPAPVTVTGCLEISTDGDTFRLNDVEGVDAPKSRSWRTGFLKKRPAPVILIEPPDPKALTTNVGRRVAATGQLTNRELKVHALQVVGSSCN